MTFGSVPGPELVVTEGELVEVTLTNLDVEDGVTLHWHGYDVPSGDDGVAGVTQDAVAPGESFVYRFVADQVGTYWYHTHQDALEGIVRGLYGAFVVLPADPAPDAAIADVTALIHTMSGTTLIGETDVLHVSQIGPTRLRLANTDQTPHRIVLDADTQLLALDGTDLAESATLRAGTSLRIPAGGRADLLVDESRPVTLDVERGGSSGIMIGGDTVPGELSFRGPEFDILDAASGPMPSWADGPFDVEGSQVLDRLIRIVGRSPAPGRLGEWRDVPQHPADRRPRRATSSPSRSSTAAPRRTRCTSTVITCSCSPGTASRSTARSGSTRST